MINIAKPFIGEEEKNAMIEVMGSGMIACGAVVSEFEEKFASYIGTKYGIATTSGTTALEVALRALDIGKGDKVITTAYSFIASSNSIVYVGATPIFVDIDEKTFNLDLVQLEKALIDHPEAKAILLVHLFGQAMDMDAVASLAQKYGVKIIEDCAQAHGSQWKDKKVGSIGDIAAFSFYPTKNMTTGEGGIVLTSDEKLAEKAKLLINHGMKVRYTHDIVGYNYRMTNMAAAIGLVQLKRLEGFNDARRKNAAKYNVNIINPLIEIPFVADGVYHVYHQYTIKVKNDRRDDMIKLFEKNSIGYGVFYPFSIPEQPCYKNMGLGNNCPVTDVVKKQVLSIPVHPALTEEEVSKVICVINALK